MPPKVKLSRDEIAESAFEIIRSEGYGALNARALASRLEISTMPLFHYFECMDDIRSAAVELAVARYTSYIDEGMKQEVPFKGIGTAYIRFAKEEPELFKMFFMTPNDEIIGLPETDPNYGRVHGLTTEIMNGNVDDGARIYKNMWIFVHGIASLIVTARFQFSEEEISRMSSEVFAALRSQMMKEDSDGERD